MGYSHSDGLTERDRDVVCPGGCSEIYRDHGLRLHWQMLLYVVCK